MIIWMGRGYATTEGWTVISAVTQPARQSPSEYENDTHVLSQQSTFLGIHENTGTGNRNNHI